MLLPQASDLHSGYSTVDDEDMQTRDLLATVLDLVLQVWESGALLGR